ncbi:hypothetical protein ZIOFF_063491 [Zingiber officinale]|uniref:Uncharacterized protein n=1 Tax=Zingiber officinale TaxID=94328 RepID=A0A8J5KG89_ZINOF|nr:hypothetical protein ZIOFF_063491 [Zingiber officinale]
MQMMGDAWRRWRTKVKATSYDSNIPLEELVAIQPIPHGLTPQTWEVLCNYWKSTESQENGRKSSRIEIQQLSRRSRKKGGAAIDDENLLKEAVDRLLKDKPEGTQPLEVHEEAFREVFGPEHSGGVRCLGAGALPSQVLPEQLRISTLGRLWLWFRRRSWMVVEHSEGDDVEHWKLTNGRFEAVAGILATVGVLAVMAQVSSPPCEINETLLSEHRLQKNQQRSKMKFEENLTREDESADFLCGDYFWNAVYKRSLQREEWRKERLPPNEIVSLTRVVGATAIAELRRSEKKERAGRSVAPKEEAVDRW